MRNLLYALLSALIPPIELLAMIEDEAHERREMYPLEVFGRAQVP